MKRLSERADRLLGRAATTAIATAVLLIGATAGSIAWPQISASLGVKPAVRAPAYRTGEVVDVPADWYQASPRTVVLFAQAACEACQKAQPFLKQLVTDLKGRVVVVLAGPGRDRESDAAYGRSIGLNDGSIQVAPEGLKVRATPTLVVVNQRGEILGAWEGIGPAEQQSAIGKAIEQAMR